MIEENGNLILNEEDIDWILKRYIATYRWNNENKLPKKIIFRSCRDYVELSDPQWREIQGKKVKYEYGGFGDTSGHKRTRGDSKSTTTKRGSQSRTTKSTESK
jgi:hypothetical protein